MPRATTTSTCCWKTSSSWTRDAFCCGGGGTCTWSSTVIGLEARGGRIARRRLPRKDPIKKILSELWGSAHAPRHRSRLWRALGSGSRPGGAETRPRARSPAHGSCAGPLPRRGCQLVTIGFRMLAVGRRKHFSSRSKRSAACCTGSLWYAGVAPATSRPEERVGRVRDVVRIVRDTIIVRAARRFDGEARAAAKAQRWRRVRLQEKELAGARLRLRKQKHSVRRTRHSRHGRADVRDVPGAGQHGKARHEARAEREQAERTSVHATTKMVRDEITSLAVGVNSVMTRPAASRRRTR